MNDNAFNVSIFSGPSSTPHNPFESCHKLRTALDVEAPSADYNHVPRTKENPPRETTTTTSSISVSPTDSCSIESPMKPSTSTTMMRRIPRVSNVKRKEQQQQSSKCHNGLSRTSPTKSMSLERNSSSASIAQADRNGQHQKSDSPTQSTNRAPSNSFSKPMAGYRIPRISDKQKTSTSSTANEESDCSAVSTQARVGTRNHSEGGSGGSNSGKAGSLTVQETMRKLRKRSVRV